MALLIDVQNNYLKLFSQLLIRNKTWKFSQQNSSFCSSSTIRNDFGKDSERKDFGKESEEKDSSKDTETEDFGKDSEKIDNPDKTLQPPCYSTYSKLLTERESLQLKPRELAVYPLDCFRWKPIYFADSSTVHNWWSALEKNINSLDVRELSNTMRGLGQLNKSMKGKVQNVFGWKQILVLVENCMKKFSQHNEASLSMILQALLRFDRKTMTVDEEQRLKLKLATSLNLFVDDFAIKTKNCFTYGAYGNNMGQVFYRFTKLDIEAPSEECVKKIVDVYLRGFNIQRRPTTDFSIVFVKDLDALGQTFLSWKINPNQFDDKFWCRWYKEMSTHFPFLRRNYDGRAVFLRTFLQVAIEYDQEVEFNKIKFMWMDHFRLTRDYFTKQDAKMLLDKIAKKYFPKPDSEDEFGMKPIVVLLESV